MNAELPNSENFDLSPYTKLIPFLFIIEFIMEGIGEKKIPPSHFFTCISIKARYFPNPRPTLMISFCCPRLRGNGAHENNFYRKQRIYLCEAIPMDHWFVNSFSSPLWPTTDMLNQISPATRLPSNGHHHPLVDKERAGPRFQSIPSYLIETVFQTNHQFFFACLPDEILEIFNAA